jgi:PKD repeat protein
VIGWFVWHYLHGQLWEREDALGKRFFVYINSLNEELSKLPRFKPKPQVLVIRDQMMSFQVGLCCDLGLFNEWDVVNQRTFAKKEMDLSQYRLIVVNEDRYYDEVVEKLNEYVKSGGNLVLLGGFGWDQTNIYDDEPRKSKFLMEEGVSQEHIWGNISINISPPNPLGLDLQYEYFSSSVLAISKNTLSENHHPVGEFYLADEQGSPIPMEYCPLVLYHNSSNPEEGSVLFWGVVSGPGPSLGIPDVQYEDVVEVFLPEWNYTRFLYRNVTRAFAENYIHMNGSLATSGTENMIITQSKMEEGVILAGISNYYPRAMNFNYTLDLDTFDLPDGEYWVHSLDENLTLGWFESQQSLLQVPLNIVANGTRLLLISQKQLEPSYSVNIFPNIPTPEEVEDLWAKDVPSASFTHFPTEPSPRDSVSFVDNSTDPNGTIVYWFWNFGDSEQPWSIEQTPTHQFTQEGEYNVGLTIVDNDGCTNTTHQTVIVQNLPPTAYYTYSPSIITAGQEVSFSDDSSHPQGHTLTSWSWHFGDGSTSTERNPTHKYENPGSYTVTLTVRDDEEMEGTHSTTIDVEPEQIQPDYAVYFVIGGSLIATVFAVVVIMRRKLS